MGRIDQLLDQKLSDENLDLLQRSIECICGERGVSPDSDAGHHIARRALILFYAGTVDESDLRQALRKPTP